MRSFYCGSCLQLDFSWILTGTSSYWPLSITTATNCNWWNSGQKAKAKKRTTNQKTREKSTTFSVFILIIGHFYWQTCRIFSVCAYTAHSPKLLFWISPGCHSKKYSFAVFVFSVTVAGQCRAVFFFLFSK